MVCCPLLPTSHFLVNQKKCENVLKTDRPDLMGEGDHRELLGWLLDGPLSSSWDGSCPALSHTFENIGFWEYMLGRGVFWMGYDRRTIEICLLKLCKCVLNISKFFRIYKIFLGAFKTVINLKLSKCTWSKLLKFSRSLFFFNVPNHSFVPLPTFPVEKFAFTVTVFQQLAGGKT